MSLNQDKPTGASPSGETTDPIDTILDVDIDFGYAVGNIMQDATPESREALRAAINTEIARQVEQAKVDTLKFLLEDYYMIDKAFDDPMVMKTRIFDLWQDLQAKLKGKQ